MTLPRDHWRVNCNSTAQRAVSGPPATCSWSTESNTCLWKAHLSTKISNRLKATSKEWVYFPNSGTSDLLCLPYGDWAGWGRYRTRVHDSSCVWSWVDLPDAYPTQPDCLDRCDMNEMLPLLVIMRLFSVCQLRNNWCHPMNGSFSANLRQGCWNMEHFKEVIGAGSGRVNTPQCACLRSSSRERKGWAGGGMGHIQTHIHSKTVEKQF